MNYGRAVKIVRTARRLSQGQLAERLSVGASQLSLIEAGKRQPSLKVLDEISTALQVPPHLLALLASEPADINERQNPEQVAELARGLLHLLISTDEQRTLPMEAPVEKRRRRKRSA